MLKLDQEPLVNWLIFSLNSNIASIIFKMFDVVIYLFIQFQLPKFEFSGQQIDSRKPFMQRYCTSVKKQMSNNKHSTTSVHLFK